MISYIFNSNHIPYKPLPPLQQKGGISKLSFGVDIYVPERSLEPEDAATLSQPLMQNTYFGKGDIVLTLDKLMKSFPDKLNPRKPLPEGSKPLNFYIYGCSDGREPYTVIMYLIKRFGSIENAAKRVKIHSIDISSPGLDMALSQTIKNISIFEEGFLKNNGLSLEAIKDKKKEIKNGIFVSAEAFKYANFRKGRIIDEFAPNGSFGEEAPCVVFFRSALPYIKPQIADTLIDNMASKLPKGSILVLGDYDNEERRRIKKVRSTFKSIKVNKYVDNEYLFKN